MSNPVSADGNIFDDDPAVSLQAAVNTALGQIKESKDSGAGAVDDMKSRLDQIAGNSDIGTLERVDVLVNSFYKQLSEEDLVSQSKSEVLQTLIGYLEICSENRFVQRDLPNGFRAASSVENIFRYVIAAENNSLISSEEKARLSQIVYSFCRDTNLPAYSVRFAEKLFAQDGFLPVTQDLVDKVYRSLLERLVISSSQGGSHYVEICEFLTYRLENRGRAEYPPEEGKWVPGPFVIYLSDKSNKRITPIDLFEVYENTVTGLGVGGNANLLVYLLSFQREFLGNQVGKNELMRAAIAQRLVEIPLPRVFSFYDALLRFEGRLLPEEIFGPESLLKERDPTAFVNSFLEWVSSSSRVIGKGAVAIAKMLTSENLDSGMSSVEVSALRAEAVEQRSAIFDGLFNWLISSSSIYSGVKAGQEILHNLQFLLPNIPVRKQKVVLSSIAEKIGKIDSIYVYDLTNFLLEKGEALYQTGGQRGTFEAEEEVGAAFETWEEFQAVLAEGLKSHLWKRDNASAIVTLVESDLATVDELVGQNPTEKFIDQVLVAHSSACTVGIAKSLLERVALSEDSDSFREGAKNAATLVFKEGNFIGFPEIFGMQMVATLTSGDSTATEFLLSFAGDLLDKDLLNYEQLDRFEKYLNLFVAKSSLSWENFYAIASFGLGHGLIDLGYLESLNSDGASAMPWDRSDDTKLPEEVIRFMQCNLEQIPATSRERVEFVVKKRIEQSEPQAAATGAFPTRTYIRTLRRGSRPDKGGTATVPESKSDRSSAERSGPVNRG